MAAVWEEKGLSEEHPYVTTTTSSEYAFELQAGKISRLRIWMKLRLSSECSCHTLYVMSSFPVPAELDAKANSVWYVDEFCFYLHHLRDPNNTNTPKYCLN
jgi:hypothetical protein